MPLTGHEIRKYFNESENVGKKLHSVCICFHLVQSINEKTRNLMCKFAIECDFFKEIIIYY